MERIFLPLNKTNKILKSISTRNRYILGLSTTILSLQPLQIETIQVVPVKLVGLTETHSYSPQSQSKWALWDRRVQWIIPGWASPEKLTPAGVRKTDWGTCQSSSAYTSEANTYKTDWHPIAASSLQHEGSKELGEGVCVYLWTSKIEIVNSRAEAPLAATGKGWL